MLGWPHRGGFAPYPKIKRSKFFIGIKSICFLAFKLKSANPRTFRLTVVCAVLFAFLFPYLAADQELVQNGGFEDKDFFGWTLSGNAAGASVITGFDESPINSGSSAAELSASTSFGSK
jgi:hypothetical protein